VDPPRPEGGSRFDAVLTHWAVRLVVVISMLAALVVGVVGGGGPANASSPALWAELSPTTSPPGLSAGSLAYDPATGQTILFGGNANSTALNATWAWTGTTWGQVDDASDAGCTSACTSSPSARYGASLAYDTATSQLLLFGGTNGGTWFNETWSWTGTTWTEITPTTVPPVRAGASLAYDGASGQGNLILFGGYNGTSYLQDTWTCSGTNWVSLSPATKPPVREEASFGYDTATSQLILFGGYNGSDLADTWSWTGTNWSALSPATSPPARFGAGTPYSPAIGELALFGGQGASYYGDTWVWTQSGNWALLSSSTSPTARVLPAMTFDPATGQMVLFGGSNGPSYDPDTWQWSAVAVSGVSPSAGPLAGGTSATITGIGFNGVTAVKFGSVALAPGSYSVVSPGEITATAPPESAGTVDITVTTPSGTSATSVADRFMYGARITGTVTDASDPAGLSGVCVSASSPVGNGHGVTASDGTYSIAGLPAGSYTVVFDPTCAGSVNTPDLEQWYNDAPIASDATLVSVTASQTASSIDAILFSTAGTVPGAPTDVIATADNAAAVVTRSDPENNGSAITSYTVIAFDSTTPGNGGEGCIAGAPRAISCTVAGLSYGDSYTFTVRATNGVGTGRASEPSNSIIPTSVPGAPTGVSATMSTTNTSATVSWTAPTQTGGSAITSYVATASGYGEQACTTTGATSCIVTGLVNGASYSFTVVALNAVGPGAPSAPSNGS